MPKPALDIFFPVETINRELDYRLLLAVKLAAPGRRIVLGTAESLGALLPETRGGIYVGKHIFLSLFPECGRQHYQQLKERDFRLLHLDEEGAFFAGEEDDWRAALDRRLDPRVLQCDDVICTWGSFQREHYASVVPRMAENIVATGHPRFDLYKKPFRAYFETDAHRLREKYGAFVLINTNLTLANPSLGLDWYFPEKSAFDGSAADSAERLNRIRFWAYQSSVLASMVELGHELSAAFPNVNVIVRCHPSENNALYKTLFRGVANLKAVHEGPVTPWILAADTVIHDGCTTAIEARLAGTPIINFRPHVSPRLENPLPNLFGQKCHEIEEVVDQVSAILDGDTKMRSGEVDARAASVLSNFEREAIAPFVAILEEMADECEGRPQQTLDIGALTQRERLRTAARAAKSLIRPLFPEKQRHYESNRKTFYGFHAVPVSERVRRLETILGKRVHHKVISDYLMVIEG